MFIETEATPNPVTLKFLPGRQVMGTGTKDYRKSDTAGDSPLASRLFAVDGVEAVFFGADFITVTKDEGVRAGTTAAKLAKLKPVFNPKDGTTTAGNSSQVTDGAAAVLLARRSVAKALGLPIQGRFHSFATAGVVSHSWCWHNCRPRTMLRVRQAAPRH